MNFKTCEIFHGFKYYISSLNKDVAIDSRLSLVTAS